MVALWKIPAHFALALIMKLSKNTETSLFPKRKHASVQARKQKVLELVQLQPGISTAQLARDLEMQYAAVRRQILEPMAIIGEIHSNPKNCWHLGKRP